MDRNELVTLYQRFLVLCEAYVENPDILTGLALDELTGRFKQASISQLGDQALHELLHRLLRAIPRQDMGEFQRLLGEIRSAATEHDLT